jgi:hypothetical protein
MQGGKEDLVWRILFLLANSSNSDETNWGPLSETICSGIPNRCLRVVMVLVVVVFTISAASAHLE